LDGVLFLGAYLPRMCGIATLTSGLPTAVAAKHPASECFSVSMNDINEGYEYRDVVQFEIEDQDLSWYLGAADFRNISNVDVACWQARDRCATVQNGTGTDIDLSPGALWRAHLSSRSHSPLRPEPGTSVLERLNFRPAIYFLYRQPIRATIERGLTVR
jgi:hypothetical protein